jgi:hypothetical protein
MNIKNIKVCRTTENLFEKFVYFKFDCIFPLLFLFVDVHILWYIYQDMRINSVYYWRCERSFIF